MLEITAQGLRGKQRWSPPLDYGANPSNPFFNPEERRPYQWDESELDWSRKCPCGGEYRGSMGGWKCNQCGKPKPDQQNQQNQQNPPPQTPPPMPSQQPRV